MMTCKSKQLKLYEDEEYKICFERSFASYAGKTNNDKLKVKCWSSKNKNKPREVTKNSGKKYWFDCDNCPHSFDTALNDINKGCWCPYCSKPCLKLCEHKECEFCYNNSFASYDGKTSLGKLKVECWSSKNKNKPREVTKNSHKKYWFKCDYCHHSFDTALRNINNGSLVPILF